VIIFCLLSYLLTIDSLVSLTLPCFGEVCNSTKQLEERSARVSVSFLASVGGIDKKQSLMGVMNCGNGLHWLVASRFYGGLSNWEFCSPLKPMLRVCVNTTYAAIDHAVIRRLNDFYRLMKHVA